MAVRFSDEQVVQATGGRRTRPGARAAYEAVSTDSRNLPKGALFVALKGERFDGHAFVAQAARDGAAAAVVAKGAAIGDVPPGVAIFEVEDTLAALGRLARFHRLRFRGKIGAVGGSNGKTTTKEMVGAILAAHGPSLKTEGNLNNEIGVPLTLFRLEPAHQTAVIEMGMNHPGEMARLTTIVHPDAAMLTVIQPEHLEGLGSLEGVAEAEGELFRGLHKEATCVVNLDDPHIVAQAKQSGAKKLTFGRAANADVRLVKVDTSGREGMTLSIQAGDSVSEVPIAFIGEHNALNATGAFAMGLALGIRAELCARGLSQARPHARRLRLVPGEGGISVLDDCYNANPGSMAAALETLAQTSAKSPGGRAVAVLGDMLELGAAEEGAHEALGKLAAERAVRVAFFGARSKVAHAAASPKLGPEAAHFTEVEPLLAWLRQDLGGGDVVLVKGSRGMRLERVVDALAGTQGPAGGH